MIIKMMIFNFTCLIIIINQYYFIPHVSEFYKQVSHSKSVKYGWHSGLFYIILFANVECTNFSKWTILVCLVVFAVYFAPQLASFSSMMLI